MQRILNIIGWIGTALVIVAVGLRIFGPPGWDRYAMYMAWAGLVCVLLYPLGQWREIAAQFNRRQARYASVALTSLIVVLGILIAVNYLSNRRHKRWDLTANSVHTLSEQSQKVLSGLDSPLKITLFDQSLPLRELPRSARAVRKRLEACLGRIRGRRPRAGEGQAVRSAGLPYAGAPVQRQD